MLESGHTVILGWSDKIFGVLAQLCLANESEGGGVVVLLSEMPKQDQEDILRKKALNTLGTVIICRQGSPLVGVDLDRVSAHLARSVVVLSDDSLRPDQADARSLRVALSFVSEIQQASSEDRRGGRAAGFGAAFRADDASRAAPATPPRRRRDDAVSML